jgi:hypothetical protein
MSTQSQSKQIYEYLKTHPEGMTPLQALEIVHCMRLAARINDIRHSILDSTKEKIINLNKSKFACYVLVYVQDQLKFL